MQYYGKEALLKTWEEQPMQLQAEEHEYLLGLKVRIRMVRNYILHRSDVEAEV